MSCWFCDVQVISELRRTSLNNKSIRTPIKMLIAEEMSKETISTETPPNVVARLMGLDAVICQQPHLASQRSHSRNFSYSNVPMDYWQQEHESLESQELHEIRQYPEQNNFKDVYEIWQSHNDRVRDKASQKERYSESPSEKKMALIRQKFTDLKLLATDEKLRQTKQFQDALEVLSSNNDLFLRFLQEPNSMFSQHLCNLQSFPPSSNTKRITVLRPAKMVDSSKVGGSQKQIQIKKSSQTEQVGKDKRTFGFSSPTNCKAEDSHIQTTRIVVLKPSLAKSQDTKTVVLPHSSLPSALGMEDDHGEPESDGARESSEIGKEVKQQVCENFSGHRKDGTLLSSVFSNGYIGDKSSFDKSENVSAEENLSDTELMSQTSRHSWDHKSRSDSRYSQSFSRKSYSPESSVCREAKKRLSERWAMMASSGSCQEKRHMQRSSSTLGEMLAISDTKKSPGPEEDSSHIQEARVSTSCLITNSNGNNKCDAAFTNFSRSKSVPVSSTIYGLRRDLEASGPNIDKTESTKEVTKERTVKFKLKERVSSLFFSRNKKNGKKESSQPSVTDPGCHSSNVAFEHDSDIALSSKASSSDLLSSEPKRATSPTEVSQLCDFTVFLWSE